MGPGVTRAAETPRLPRRRHRRRPLRCSGGVPRACRRDDDTAGTVPLRRKCVSLLSVGILLPFHGFGLMEVYAMAFTSPL